MTTSAGRQRRYEKRDRPQRVQDARFLFPVADSEVLKSFSIAMNGAVTWPGAAAAWWVA